MTHCTPYLTVGLLGMTASPRHSVYVYYALRFLDIHHYAWPRHSVYVYYALRFLDIRKNRVRVDEELRLLHNHRRARCLDVQCNAHCRLCTVGLRRTKRHCSSQFREYVATNYRPKRRILGRVSVYSRYSILLSSVQTGPMHADSEWALYWYQNQVIAPSHTALVCSLISYHCYAR